MSYLRLEHITKRYTRQSNNAVEDVSFSLQQGKILAIVGESGCGKTTLLRIIAGLEMPDAGSVVLDGKTFCDANTYLPPEKRKVGLVFQDYALFPHMTVAKNIAYGLNGNAPEKQARVQAMLELVGLVGFDHRYPSELSGGEQQRVALARALAPQPKLLLMDEPFSNLDVIKKDLVRQEVEHIIKQTNTTAIFVTHDTQEACSLSDHIIVLQAGKKLQEGSPQAIYEQPVNEYVARFFGR